eukprot:4939820-Prymnesium_polylepis.1
MTPAQNLRAARAARRVEGCPSVRRRRRRTCHCTRSRSFGTASSTLRRPVPRQSWPRGSRRRLAHNSVHSALT